LALAVSAFVVGIDSVFAQINTVQSQLQFATNEFAQAFVAVSDAQKAGANVTFLVAQLNSAAGSLSQADMLFARGDFNGTVAAASAASLAAQSIIPQAQSLEAAAQVSSRNAAFNSVIFSVAGVVVFLSVLFLIWSYVKKSYLRNILEAKPEVIEG
jgi:hypothetical protein